MATTITIDPVTRIEGHLSIEVTVDDVGGERQVIDAHSSGTMFRAFEVMLQGRDPRDAAQLTQRICGVCPVSHAMASCRALDQAFGVAIPDNGRILRNLVLGANFIQSHLLHFYHLSILDFIDTTGLLDQSPWVPRHPAPDLAAGTAAADLVAHYLAALEMRRTAHQMGAIFAGKLPCTGSFVVGGCTEFVTSEKITEFRGLLLSLRNFIDTIYLNDAAMLSSLFPAYSNLGAGSGNLLAFGAFDLDAAGSSRLFAGGRITTGTPGTVDPANIVEHVDHSWYTPASGGLNPGQGVTEPDAEKTGAYSWLKAPRYSGASHELGALARLWVNGLYTTGVSAMDRILARAQESKMIADAMDGWLDELVPGDDTYQAAAVPMQATSIGMTEAPRGALGHWLEIDNRAISRYQVVTPTNWNASPRDAVDAPGPIEEALVGTPVLDDGHPVEVLRVVHSFDPCIACAVHVIRPDDRPDRKITILSRPGEALK